MRFAVALLVAVVAVAGCTGGPTGPTTTETETSPTDSPTMTTCNEVPRGTVDPYRDDVNPTPLPDRPDALNESSVHDYVVAYEEAYARNGRLRADSTRVSVSVFDVRVNETGDGWVVRLTSRTNTWAQGTDTSDGTPTVVHGDGAHIPVVYELTDERLTRGEGDYNQTPSPTVGETVECF